jgi:predicted nucleic acid-binding protein
MTVDHKTLLFFDASCLIAAAGSSTGGSGLLLSLCVRRLLRGVVSQAVLLEAESNIQSKLRRQALSDYHTLLQTAHLSIAPIPPVLPASVWLQEINAKDVHVVAAALAAKAPYVLTLDRKLALEINSAALSIEALTPGDFIRNVLPLHTSYPTLRS